MSTRTDINVFYIVTTINSPVLEQTIYSESALRSNRSVYVCDTWQDARRRWREYCVDAYRVEYSCGRLISIQSKMWY